ncbi:MAG: hypothetical protein ABWX61_06885 [Paenisporosarcina sp.]
MTIGIDNVAEKLDNLAFERVILALTINNVAIRQNIVAEVNVCVVT